MSHICQHMPHQHMRQELQSRSITAIDRDFHPATPYVWRGIAVATIAFWTTVVYFVVN